MTDSKRTLAVTGIGLGVIVLGMLWSIVNTALASIQKDVSATVLQLQWMMNSFGIGMCVPLLTMGKLGDAYGRKRVYLWGLFAALIASTLAGFASRVEVLIACMALFGVSGSIILPLSLRLFSSINIQKGKKGKQWLFGPFLPLCLSPEVPWLGG